jgi:dihydrodipicolinate synthase/N-acetylneuraminate lyase
MSKPFSGVIPPIVTPFKNDELDLEAFKANFGQWNKVPLGGYLVAGTAGESPHLSAGEKEQLFAAARELIPHDRAFLAGVGAQSTRDSIALARIAGAQGADYALALTPFYFRGQMDGAAWEAHYRRLADESPIPVVIYNGTPSSGLNIAPDTVARLAEHGNVVGVKCGAGNVAQLRQFVRRTPADFAVLTGAAAIYYPALCVGVDGCGAAVGNLAPATMVALERAVKQGDHARALELQDLIAPLGAMVSKRWGVGGLKLAMDLAGRRGGEVRLPLSKPSDAQTKEILRAELAKLSAMEKEYL